MDKHCAQCRHFVTTYVTELSYLAKTNLSQGMLHWIYVSENNNFIRYNKHKTMPFEIQGYVVLRRSYFF